MEKTVGAYEARRQFGRLIEEAFYQKDSFVVERSGRPMAAIVPIDTYQRWRRVAKERVFLMLEEVWQRNEGTPDEVLENEVEQALETLRQDRLASNGA
jgi:prevent-host-death family protein